jgi:hypothetical protein
MHAFLEKFFLIAHVLAGAVWTGAVFMAAVIDWRALRRTHDRRVFPFDFVVTHGSLIFLPVYAGMITLFITGIGLLWLHPPGTVAAWSLVGVKSVSLLFMAGATLYGTFVSWPKLQFALHEEAYGIYDRYIFRAYFTFGFGCVGLVSGTLLSRLPTWFP